MIGRGVGVSIGAWGPVGSGDGEGEGDGPGGAVCGGALKPCGGGGRPALWAKDEACRSR